MHAKVTLPGYTPDEVWVNAGTYTTLRVAEVQQKIRLQSARRDSGRERTNATMFTPEKPFKRMMMMITNDDVDVPETGNLNCNFAWQPREPESYSGLSSLILRKDGKNWYRDLIT